MSRPRAATSVATRTRISPDLKPSRARVRSGCERSRVDGDGVDALAIEPRGEPRGGQLGPGEDEDLAQVVLADEVGEQRFLAVAVDRVDELAGRASAAVLRGATSTVAGSRRIVPDRRRMSSENVAENIRFWRCGGSSARILLDVRQEAHVEHPVGLVEDEDLDLAEVGDAVWPTRSSSRPGVATRISTPPRSALIWGSIGMPP